MTAKKITFYFQLMKPGIVYISALLVTSGFIFGSYGQFSVKLYISVSIGSILVAASSCVFNNYIDRHIDKKMKRTKKRPLVTGDISPRSALIYGAALATIGFLVVLFFTNPLTTTITVVAVFMYVGGYSIMKRRFAYGTLFAVIPVALTPIVGYSAASGRIDMQAGVIFAAGCVMASLQYYKIMTLRRADYRAARLPIPPRGR